MSSRDPKIALLPCTLHSVQWGVEKDWRQLLRKGLGLPLTIHVIPGQILEGLIEQNDRQRHLEHHPPLSTT